MNLAAGARLGHYEIIAPLGAGGMGEVYRARDKRLNREVAIKVLPARLADDQQALARFEREATSLASLSHPNILTIHDFGTENGITYAVMELLEGESLRSRISRAPIPWNRALEIGAAIAEGLAAAHSRGVIHRDLKPENIFLTAHGSIKILDFGLARTEGITSADGKSELPTVAADTEPGTVLGTLGYMSPEQLRGGSIDARSDIFSFGCVLYEMLTGNSPFRRNTAADTMAAVLNSEPPLLSSSAQMIPPEMDRVIMHCLEKDPEQRFHSARDLAFDLREIASGSRSSAVSAAIAAPKSISYRWAISIVAVLLIAAIAIFFRSSFTRQESGERIPIAVADFINETGEKDLDGLSGMLITSLEQSRRLSVLTRSRMFDLLKQMGKENVDRIDESIGREICKQANVNALVLASIRKFDQLYTIDLKILDPQKNEYLFTAKEEGTGKSNVPAMIDKLSEDTRVGLKEQAREIQIATKKVGDVTTTNLEAYQHFYKGEELINKLKFKEAETEFNQAIALDPEFSLAYFRRTYAISWLSSARAQISAAEALRHASRLPEKEKAFIDAFKAYGLERNPEKAIATCKRVLGRYPQEKEGLFAVGDWSYHAGDYQTAIAYLQKVLALDPSFERALQHITWAYGASRQFDKELQAAKDYVARAASEDSYGLLIGAYLRLGDFDRAFKTARTAIDLYPKAFRPRKELGQLYLRTGQTEKAEEEMKKFIQETGSREDQEKAYREMAWIYVPQGKIRDALVVNQKAIEINTELKNDEEFPELYGQRVWFYLLAGDQNNARETFRQCMKYAQNNPNRDAMEAAFALDEIDIASEQVQKELWAHIPYAEMMVEAYGHRLKGETGEAIRNLETISQRGLPLDQSLRSFDLAALYLETGDLDRALQTINRTQSPNMQAFDVYPRMFYLLGKIYEKKGDRKQAAENYNKALQIWRNADADYPEAKDAKARLAKL